MSTLAAGKAGVSPGSCPQTEALPLAGIVIDVPDVLYDATLWRLWFFQLLVRLEAARDYETFRRAWDAQLRDVHCGRREYAEALQSFLLDRGLSWAQVDEIEAASRIHRQTLELDVRPLPGVVDAIAQINRQGIPLVAWADSPLPVAKLAERLARILPRANFTAVLTSLDLEASQPDAECYRAMAAAIGSDRGVLLYLGHDAAHLAGARRAGFHTAAVNYESNARADDYLGRIDELTTVIKRHPRAQTTDSPRK